MKSFLAVTLGAGLLAAASTGAVAACASHFKADAPMTPIVVTADTTGTVTTPAAPDKKS
ncbi:hypothetical protein VQ042_12565 [Aurantimonas sp. A2-1-M11]|uniref:hypothetical protein n=1 Tax=Aurantimonas sp. A2-1-M11 TaxID=3113712 RepID=UPI002F937778